MPASEVEAMALEELMQLETTLSQGEIVAERYRVLEPVGSGGYSTVYRAREPTLGRDVALKVLDFDPDRDNSREVDRQRTIERFRREAKLIARFEHPSTVTLYDYGTTVDGACYMALEFVDGTPLSRGPERPVPPQRVVRWLIQALGSLAEAHDYGVLHRDIKPSNLMLADGADGRDHLKLIDFGIAKPLRRTDSDTLRPLTSRTSILGTPRYAAPEYVTDPSPRPASDLYSLGLVAHELLLDRKPVPRDEPIRIFEFHASEEFEVAIPSTPGVPEHLRQIVNRMTAQSLDERYRTAKALRSDLEALPDFSESYAATAVMSQPSVTAGESVAREADRASGARAPTEREHPTSPATPDDPRSDASPATTSERPPEGATPSGGRPRHASPATTTARIPGSEPPTDSTTDLGGDSAPATTETEAIPSSGPEESTPESGAEARSAALERPRPNVRTGSVTADDSIRSDGSPMPDDGSPDDEASTDSRNRRVSVPPGNTLEVEERLESDKPDVASDSSMFAQSIPSAPDWFLAAIAVVFALAALAVALLAI